MKVIKRRAIVIGANGGIGRALCKALSEEDDIDEVIAISRSVPLFALDGDNIHGICCNNSTGDIESVLVHLNKVDVIYSHVFICNGVLHGKDFSPEKRIESIHLSALEQVFSANVYVPILWLRALTSSLFSGLNIKNSSFVKVTVLSARVGSIEDNQLGGWYSYRASKAALNMMLKTLSIELSRRAPSVKLIAFHPGTADTHLSRPFQGNVPEGKLFDVNFVAQRLITVLKNLHPDGLLSYVDWEGKDIPW